MAANAAAKGTTTSTSTWFNDEVANGIDAARRLLEDTEELFDHMNQETKKEAVEKTRDRKKKKQDAGGKNDGSQTEDAVYSGIHSAGRLLGQTESLSRSVTTEQIEEIGALEAENKRLKAVVGKAIDTANAVTTVAPKAATTAAPAATVGATTATAAPAKAGATTAAPASKAGAETAAPEDDGDDTVEADTTTAAAGAKAKGAGPGAASGPRKPNVEQAERDEEVALSEASKAKQATVNARQETKKAEKEQAEAEEHIRKAERATEAARDDLVTGY